MRKEKEIKENLAKISYFKFVRKKYKQIIVEKQELYEK